MVSTTRASYLFKGMRQAVNSGGRESRTKPQSQVFTRKNPPPKTKEYRWWWLENGSHTDLHEIDTDQSS